MKTLKKLFRNPYLIFILFISLLSIQNYIFCVMYTADHLNPWLVDENGNYVLSRIAFSFGQYLDDIMNTGKLSLPQFGIDLPSSRRPLLPYTLLFIYENITNNFIFIHLIKNVFFGTLIFFTIKNFKSNYNFLFLAACLFFIFYNPHNAVTNLGTENEEGILNYLIIIMFFVLISNFKYKSLYLTLIVCLIFLLKGSMFLLATLIPILFLFLEKDSKFRFFPIITIVLLNLYWGFATMKTSGFFAIGPKGSAMNAINLATVTHKYFNITYPSIRPDIHLDLVENVVNERNIKTEKELIDNLLPDSKDFIIQNPYEYLIGVLKKIYVLNLSPFKDAQYPKDKDSYLENMYAGKNAENDKIINPIRYSNIPNKIIFNVSLFLLLFSLINYKKNSKYINNLNIYYFFMLLFYLAPYMFAWIYPRHGTSVYILSHFYILIYLIEKNFFKIEEYFKT